MTAAIGDTNASVQTTSEAVADINGKLSAQWEHTLVVTATGYEIFTLRKDDTIPRTSA